MEASLIQSIEHDVAHAGWLEVDPRWLTHLFQVEATGEVRLVGGKIHVGIRAPQITTGQVVHGFGTMAFVPTGVGARPVSS